MMRSIEANNVPLSKLYTGQDLTQKEIHDLIASQIPMKRYATVDEVAKVMLFLAGDDSRLCNGAFYMVDGGA